MANTSQASMLLLLFTIICVIHVVQGYGIKEVASEFSPAGKTHRLDISEKWGNRKLAKMMIGSTAPICTYNECRGCKYKCIAEQVPVEGDDPMNSPYRYRCVCHRKTF